VLALDHQNT
jgi:multidrug resistance efflux pump